MSVCVSVCPIVYLKILFHQIFCTLLGRLYDRVDLIKPVRTYRTSVRPSTKSVFDFNEILGSPLSAVQYVMYFRFFR